jgi:hypothetical protein
MAVGVYADGIFFRNTCNGIKIKDCWACVMEKVKNKIPENKNFRFMRSAIIC